VTFSLVEVILYALAGVDEICIRTSHVYFPIFVKCDVRYMQTVIFMKIGAGNAVLFV